MYKCNVRYYNTQPLKNQLIDITLKYKFNHLILLFEYKYGQKKYFNLIQYLGT